MELDVSAFSRTSVADTCSVWNILSSRVLHSAAMTAGCVFSISAFVLYECLYKKRSSGSPADSELQSRLRMARAAGQFSEYPLSIADLQDVEVLRARKNLGKGELASLVLARKTRQAFLTDDQKARTLAKTVLNGQPVQTTPHLFGWLIFTAVLGDSSVQEIVAEHEKFSRPLRPHLEAMYREGLRCRLLAATGSAPR